MELLKPMHLRPERWTSCLGQSATSSSRIETLSLDEFKKL